MDFELGSNVLVCLLTLYNTFVLKHISLESPMRHLPAVLREVFFVSPYVFRGQIAYANEHHSSYKLPACKS